ncbi:hypothetical protein DTL42_07380 [Bremerella cremea]|uniref:Uncharacterized protein n=1 Tax=Bremerella cremea TaxID=1031537 RepID=A0A368KSW5_9BACT|nr:hypothetical protein [Bremerella cremea]RCS52653.1 hypothetical protein DTL42_07380 [Bremerella cremea]
MKRGNLTQRVLLLVGLLLLTANTGCAVSDLLFGAFGGGYSGGGETMREKRYDYDQQIQSSQGIDY